MRCAFVICLALVVAGCGSSAATDDSVATAPPTPSVPPATTADLPPATFNVPNGWVTGDSSKPGTPAEETFSWASNTRLRDAAFSAPPIKTLNAMAGNDVLIEVFLWRPGPADQAGESDHPALPLKLDATAPSQDFPGDDGTHWFQRLGGKVGNRQLDIWVFAGRRQPTSEQTHELQAVLDGLTLPAWPST